MNAVWEAGGWGLIAGSSLVLGALLGWFVAISKRLVAAIMAFGVGVLISAVTFDLVDEAFVQGGFAATAAGFFTGALVYTLVNIAISRRGGAHRKRSGAHPPQCQPLATNTGGLAIAAGALLDGIPESVVIGVSLLDGGRISLVAVIAIFLSNIPEALSSTAGMKRSGRSARFVFVTWGGITVMSGVASLVGYLAFASAAPTTLAATTAFAAGAILAMLVDTMVPEATAESHEYSGLIAAAGFLFAFILSRAGS